MIALMAMMGIPILMAIAAAVLTLPRKRIGQLNSVGMLGTLAASVATVPHVLATGAISVGDHLFRVDPLSCVMVMLVASVSFLASLYSVGYWEEQAKELEPGRTLKGYYVLFNLFVASMLVVCTVDNLGILWVALEATTLASAFLVGYYNRAASLQAAWRYLIICSVGISFALIGVILAYASAVHATGLDQGAALSWSYLMSVADRLDATTLKLAFVFAVIGFGTKAGLVPMHGWLPDAHGEAPTPVSALLSGVLVKCALYAIIRFTMLVNEGIGSHYAGPILLAFGLMSVGIAAPYILAQTHFKRLLGYSSIEHVGIIAIGLGFASQLGVYAALLHMWNHAMTKSLLFFLSGSLSVRYGTMSMSEMRGPVGVTAGTSIALLIGTLALSGAPPFSVFVSEFLILTAGVQAGRWLPVALLVAVLVIVFAAMVQHLIPIALASPPATGQQEPRPLRSQLDPWTAWALILPIVLLVTMSWGLPNPFSAVLVEASRLVTGGQR